MEKEAVKSIVQNRKARHEYYIEDNFEAGIVLKGTEVKSLRQGKVNLLDCFANISNGEVYIRGMHISPYDHGNIFNVDPLRDRKLLLHKNEILKIQSLIAQKGFTIVPLSLYFKKGKVKVDLGVAKGKKLYDKREDIAKRDTKKEMERWTKENNKY